MLRENFSADEQEFARLEQDIVTYADVIDIPAYDNGEPLLPIIESPYLLADPTLRSEMIPITGMKIYVRHSVREKLQVAACALNRVSAGLQLQVGYGYRDLTIQRQNFERKRETIRGKVPDDQLDEATHRFIANPIVAGHPTGGAVDLRITRAAKPIECGTQMWDLSRRSYSLFTGIDAVSQANRMLLRSVMTDVGFAPFNGEWWHFSYGDKEWAKYYNQPAALYEQIEFRAPGQT